MYDIYEYMTKSTTGPRVIDELLPVESRSISSQAITSLPIDIPAFDDSDGPIRYCLVDLYCYHFDSAVTTSL